MSFVLHCCPDDAPAEAPGYVNIYHHVSRFAPRIEMLPTPWDDIAFAFQGDVVQQQAHPSAVWDQSYFHIVVPMIQVPTIVMLDQLLAQNPDSQFVGPCGEEDAGTEIIRTRRTAVVPHRYVNLLLAQSLTPREAWLRVKGTIAAARQMTECAPLIDHWLHVALTCSDNCQGRGNFTDLHRIKHHPAYRILKTYSLQGASVKLSSKPWTTAQNDAAIAHGLHKLANEYIDFLRSEMAEMVKAAQWVVLSYSKIRGRPGLRVSPIGVVPQKERRPHTIVDYSYYSLNAETLPLAHTYGSYAIWLGTGTLHSPPDLVTLHPPPTPLFPSLPVPTTLDPLLHKARKRVLAAVDIFVDDFLRAAQGNASRLSRIRCILFTAI